MEARFSLFAAAPQTYKAMLGLEQYLHGCGLQEPLVHLIKLRASQINGCAYCLDMHWKDLRAVGKTNSDCIPWTHGASAHGIQTVSVPPWLGLRLSPSLPAGTFPMPFMRRFARTCPKRTSAI